MIEFAKHELDGYPALTAAHNPTPADGAAYITTLRQRIETLQSGHTLLSTANERLQTALAERDSRIEELRQQLRERESVDVSNVALRSEVKSLKVELAAAVSGDQFHAQIGELQQRYDRAWTQIGELKAEVQAEKDCRNVWYSRAIAAESSPQSDLQPRLTAAESDADKLRAELHRCIDWPRISPADLIAELYSQIRAKDANALEHSTQLTAAELRATELERELVAQTRVSKTLLTASNAIERQCESATAELAAATAIRIGQEAGAGAEIEALRTEVLSLHRQLGKVAK